MNEKTRLSTPLENSYWVVPGKLLAGEFPRTSERTGSMLRLQAMVAAGIMLFIDLTTPGDFLEPYEGLLKEVSRGWARRMPFGIPDVSVPSSRELMADILDAIDRELTAGRGVYVHCWGGPACISPGPSASGLSMYLNGWAAAGDFQAPWASIESCFHRKLPCWQRCSEEHAHERDQPWRRVCTLHVRSATGPRRGCGRIHYHPKFRDCGWHEENWNQVLGGRPVFLFEHFIPSRAGFDPLSRPGRAVVAVQRSRQVLWQAIQLQKREGCQSARARP